MRYNDINITLRGLSSEMKKHLNPRTDPIYVEAEKNVAEAIDKGKYSVEIVHLGESKNRVVEAEQAGVKSVPALVLDGIPFHINFGADLSALK